MLHVVVIGAACVLGPTISLGQATVTVVKGNVPAVLAQATTRPIEVSALERSTIVRPASVVTPVAGLSGAAASAPAGFLDFGRVVLALGAVIAIVLLLKYAARLLFPSAVGARGGKAVHVLSRSMISPKQQVMLMQVGQRLLVVGDCGSQMNTLCEITDPDEVASIIGQASQDRRDPISGGFASLFRRAGQQYSGENTVSQDAGATSDKPVSDVEPSDLASTRREVQGLMNRVRGLSQQFGKT